MEDSAFWRLRETPLHSLSAEEWPAYFRAMAPWLAAEDADTRESAVERLAMAVFRAEPNYRRDPETLARSHERSRWLFGAIEAAETRHAGVLRMFLLAMRWHADDDRGEPATHWLAATGSDPAPVRLDRAEHLAFASGASVELEGDCDARCWERIEIFGRGLRDRWHPLALAG